MRQNRRNKWIGLALGAVLAAAPLASRNAMAQDNDPFVGHFGATGVSVDLAGNPDHYTGTIHANQKDMPLNARLVNGHVEGTFTSGGATFPFKAELDGTTLSLTTGSRTFKLNGVEAPAPTPATAPAATSGGSLTVDQLSDALTPLGKNSINNNGDRYFTINVDQGQSHRNIVISLSPNGRVIWMTSDVAHIPDPARCSPLALANLLAQNTEIGPMFFGIVRQQKAIQLSQPVPNVNMTPEKVRAYVQNLLETIQKTESFWKEDVIAPDGKTVSTEDNPLGK
jgi:hypothetical protein